MRLRFTLNHHTHTARTNRVRNVENDRPNRLAASPLRSLLVFLKVSYTLRESSHDGFPNLNLSLPPESSTTLTRWVKRFIITCT